MIKFLPHPLFFFFFGVTKSIMMEGYMMRYWGIPMAGIFQIFPKLREDCAGSVLWEIVYGECNEVLLSNTEDGTQKRTRDLKTSEIFNWFVTIFIAASHRFYITQKSVTSFILLFGFSFFEIISHFEIKFSSLAFKSAMLTVPLYVLSNKVGFNATCKKMPTLKPNQLPSSLIIRDPGLLCLKISNFLIKVPNFLIKTTKSMFFHD